MSDNVVLGTLEWRGDDVRLHVVCPDCGARTSPPGITSGWFTCPKTGREFLAIGVADEAPPPTQFEPHRKDGVDLVKRSARRGRHRSRANNHDGDRTSEQPVADRIEDRGVNRRE